MSDPVPPPRAAPAKAPTAAKAEDNLPFVVMSKPSSGAGVMRPLVMLVAAAAAALTLVL